MFTLIIEDKDGSIADEFSFETGDFTIGRSTSCDIVLPSANVSRRHARLFVDDNVCYVEDVESVNGIVVDGRKASGRTPLGAASQVKVGDFYLHVERQQSQPGFGEREVKLKLHGKNLAVAGRTYSLTKNINLVGRGRDASTTIIDSSVSRVHAKLTLADDGRVLVEDLRSANGTFVNGEPVSEAPAEHGDRLRFGNVEFVLELPGSTQTLYGVTAPSMSTKRPPARAGQESAPPNSAQPESGQPDSGPFDPGPSDTDPEVTALMNVSPDVLRALSERDAQADDTFAPPAKRSIWPWVFVALAGIAVGATAVAWLRPDLLGAGGTSGPDAPAIAPGAPAPATSLQTAGAGPEPLPPEPPLAEPTAAAAKAPQAPPPAEGAPSRASSSNAAAPGNASAPTPVPTPAAAVVVDPTALDPAQERALASQGEALLASEQWRDAQTIYEELKSARPLVADYQRAYNTATLEASNRDHMTRGEAFLRARLWTEAKKAFSSVTPESQYRSHASNQIEDLAEKKRELVEQADELCKARKYEACMGYYVDALAMDPGDPAVERKLAAVRATIGPN